MVSYAQKMFKAMVARDEEVQSEARERENMISDEEMARRYSNNAEKYVVASHLCISLCFPLLNQLSRPQLLCIRLVPSIW